MTDGNLARSLATLDGWTRSEAGAEIAKTFDRKNFDGSIRFINAIAREANAQDHHPDIALSWNEVTLTLSSHDVGCLTERDVRLAKTIDAIANASE